MVLIIREEHGHANVPKRSGPLGSWTMTLRKLFRNGELSQDKIKRLEEVGFDFDPLKKKYHNNEATVDTSHASAPKSVFESSDWLDAYEALQLFVETNGHAVVPYDYDSGNIDCCLRTWLETQKHLFGQEKLPQRQVGILKKLGVDLSERDEKMFHHRSLAWNMYFNALQQCHEGNNHIESIGTGPK